MRPCLLLLPLLALAGCATGPSLHTRMAAYVGGSEEKLVQALGVPDKQITVQGISYLAYDRQHAEIESDVLIAPYGAWGYWGPHYGGPFYTSGLPQDIRVWSCEVTFTVKHSHVLGFTMKGDDCD